MTHQRISPKMTQNQKIDKMWPKWSKIPQNPKTTKIIQNYQKSKYFQNWLKMIWNHCVTKRDQHLSQINIFQKWSKFTNIFFLTPTKNYIQYNVPQKRPKIKFLQKMTQNLYPPQDYQNWPNITQNQIFSKMQKIDKKWITFNCSQKWSKIMKNTKNVALKKKD